MRLIALAVLACAGLAVMSAPAEAAWKTYVSRDFGFAFTAPGEVKAQRGTFKGEMEGDHGHGIHPAVVFRSADNNIEYTATVVDFNTLIGESASLLQEAAVVFQNGGKTVMDNYGRINNVYGRKITVDLANNGGRAMATFYFNKGYLFIMQAVVLPANGDYASPDAARFVDSEVWLPRNNLFEAHPFPPHDFPDLTGAVELGLPNLN